MNVLGPVGALPASSLEPVASAPPRVAGRDRTGLGRGGYQVTYGTSFLAAIEMTADGPVGVGVLAYGQSGDPSSPHHADGAVAYAQARLRPLRFHDEDIDADPALRSVELSGGG
jgi:acyl-homoserine-lactone acylase